MASPGGHSGPAEPVLRHPWRFAIVAVILLAVVNLAFFALSESDTTVPEDTLPTAVESVAPAPGEILQDAIVADLRNTYTGVLVIDRHEIPEDQLDRVVDLGQVSFRPGRGKDFTKFEPGLHTVVVRYWVNGRPRPANPDSFSWTFRAVS